MNRPAVPFWGVGSVILTLLAPVIGSLGITVAVAFVDKPHGVITNYFPMVARNGVLIMMAAIVVGIGFSVMSLLLHERPMGVAVLSMATNAALIVTLWQGHYYKLGYDQDRGALPPAGYFPVAKGLTAASAGQPMQIDTGMVSPPERRPQCDSATGVVRLTAVQDVRLRVEQPFPLQTLNVVAFDASGIVVPSVPIVVEIEQVTPPVLYLWPASLQRGPTPHSAGFFLFNVRTDCSQPSVEVTIKAQAVHVR